MATVFRVKRRRNEDPAESLKISSKKAKIANNSDECQIVKFVFTVDSKDVNIAAPLQDAMHKEKLAKRYPSPNIKMKLREEKRRASKTNRYRILASHRHLSDKNQNASIEQLDINNEEKEKFSLYDVEHDEAVHLTEDVITCNDIPLKKDKNVTITEGDFVYDLYYMNDGNIDFHRLEHDLMIESVGGDYICDERENDYNDYTNDGYDDDDDDSNDENNWRNDYPDEDSRIYFDDDDESRFYDNDEDSSDYQFHNEGDADHLTNWMSTRCNIEDNESLSSSDELDGGAAYYRRVKKEMFG